MVLNSSKRGTFKPSFTFLHIEIRFDPHLGLHVPQTLGELCPFPAIVFIHCYYSSLFLGQEKQDSQPLILALSLYDVCSPPLTEGPQVSLVPQQPLAFPIRSYPKALKLPFSDKSDCL